MGLNYKWTCPEIDSQIDNFKSYIEEILGDYLPNHKDSFIKDLVQDITSEFNNLAENLRTCNANLRDEAESQIKDKENNISELEEQIKDLHIELEKVVN